MDEAAPPAALEEHVEHRPPGARDAPALLGHDRAQQALGEDAMARGEHVLEPVEQPRLVGRGDARVEQRAADREPPHAGGPPDGAQAGVADDGVDRDRRRVVRAADHRREARAGAAVERAVGAQVGDEQQRLDEARRGDAARHAPAAQAPGGVDDRERDVAAALRGETRRGLQAGGARGRRRRRLRRGRPHSDEQGQGDHGDGGAGR